VKISLVLLDNFYLFIFFKLKMYLSKFLVIIFSIFYFNTAEISSAELTVFVASWNTFAHSVSNRDDFTIWLTQPVIKSKPDIVAISLQEIVPLTPSYIIGWKSNKERTKQWVSIIERHLRSSGEK
jgi:hypothetical protein